MFAFNSLCVFIYLVIFSVCFFCNLFILCISPPDKHILCFWGKCLLNMFIKKIVTRNISLLNYRSQQEHFLIHNIYILPTTVIKSIMIDIMSTRVVCKGGFWHILKKSKNRRTFHKHFPNIFSQIPKNFPKTPPSPGNHLHHHHHHHCHKHFPNVRLETLGKRSEIFPNIFRKKFLSKKNK